MFNGMKTAVIKLSGKSIDDLLNNENWVNQIKIFQAEYNAVIIVHGAGSIISNWAEKLGLKSEFLNGQRVTGEEVMDVVSAVQNGMINAKIVAHLLSKGIASFGTNGIDHGLFTARYFDSALGYVGTPESMGDPSWLFEHLSAGKIPVFSSICTDGSGHLMNVNADIFTIAIAELINADSVIFLSDVDGVKIFGKVKSVITENEINHGILNGEITAGMVPKLQSCIQLLNIGISKVWIGNDLQNINLNNENSKGTWVVSANKLSA